MRFVGLDAWRAFLLCYGVLVHAANRIRMLPDDPMIFEVIQSTSRTARMQAFFLIAGFLAARSIDKHGRFQWLRSRVVQLLVPLIFIMATFQRMTDWVNYGDPLATLGKVDHLWFLLVLTAFSLLTVLLQTPRLRQWITDMVQKAQHLPAPAITGCIIGGTITLAFAGILAMQCIYFAFPAIAHKDGAFSNFYVLSRIFAMTPFYLLGHLLAQDGVLLRCRATPLFIVAVCAMAAYIALYDDATYVAIDVAGIPHALVALTMHLAMAVAGACFSIAIFIHARSVLRVPTSVMAVSKASYTIYLVHLFYVAAAFVLLSRPGQDHYLLFAAVVSAALLLSFLTHKLVASQPILAFLVNGKGLRARTPMPATS
ncbi:acyltransferase family protein [Novosphingobium gossypii]|uniref:acyltransferase family protein n=1 Tax=Novosphingobium gossypii TaxID=1604774 RepID=UPI003D1A08A0